LIFNKFYTNVVKEGAMFRAWPLQGYTYRACGERGNNRLFFKMNSYTGQKKELG
jgi:hypothetical protein